ncbi:MAG: hypothetical protein ACI4JZ_06890 [Oscillospiraceae bacterium]
MHGKATLILTDKDTGRIVEQIEEHNMVTNALSSIFSLPPQIAYDKSAKYIFNGFLPMYENALKGLVLFSENVPENAYDYMLGGKYNVLATAGDAYSGTDAMRGTFNASSSGEIENGYRFVWDFAPEKAVGTIKALSLTNRLLGNRGDLTLAGADSYYMINPSDLTNNGNYNSSVPLLSGSGTFFLQKGDNTFYSYVTGNPFIKILRYRISDPLGLKICDTISGVLEDETQITLGFATSSTTSQAFYDPKTERLYCVLYTYETVGSARYFKYRYAVINHVACEKEFETDYISTSVPHYANAKIAFYDGKMYVYDSTFTIYVCSLSGEIESTINLGLNAINGFLTLDGKLAVDCKFTSSGRRCIYVFDENKTALTQYASPYMPLATDIVKYPYCLASYGSAVYIMFRTDYLATINNLTAPLEKTDQHALQVRYEITN